MQVVTRAEPWTQGFNRLASNSHTSLNHGSNAMAIVYRDSNGAQSDNYGKLYLDVTAAYALALRWWISSEDAYAEKAVEMLKAWGCNLTEINGTSDKYLASGIYGYQMANAAELYSGWETCPFEPSRP